MDAQEYDRIADLLMQIRMKYSTLGVRKLSMAMRTSSSLKECVDALDLVDILLKMNDKLGELDGKGWLR